MNQSKVIKQHYSLFSRSHGQGNMHGNREDRRKTVPKRDQSDDKNL